MCMSWFASLVLLTQVEATTLIQIEDTCGICEAKVVGETVTSLETATWTWLLSKGLWVQGFLTREHDFLLGLLQHLVKER